MLSALGVDHLQQTEIVEVVRTSGESPEYGKGCWHGSIMLYHVWEEIKHPEDVRRSWGK